MKSIYQNVIIRAIHALTIIVSWPRWLLAIGIILTSIVFYTKRGEPTEVIVQYTLRIFEYIGLMVALIPLYVGALNYPSYDPTITIFEKMKFIVDQVQRVLIGIFLYSISVYLIGVYGDSIYKTVLSNPEVSIASATASLIAWLTAVALKRRATWSHGVAFSGSVSARPIGAAILSKPLKITERDSRYIAAHEAAHALIYSALGALPSGFKIVINDDPDGHSPLGYVSRVQLDHQLSEKEFAEWDMLVLLAGKIGEETLHDGKATLGSGNDNAHWLCIASSYLSNLYGGVFYNPPQNKIEIDQNEDKLLTLRSHQVELLRLFFQMNTDVFKSLTDTLLTKRTLLGDDVEMFFRQVTFPDGFPFPFGKFEQFGERAIPDLNKPE